MLLQPQEQKTELHSMRAGEGRCVKNIILRYLKRFVSGYLKLYGSFKEMKLQRQVINLAVIQSWAFKFTSLLDHRINHANFH